ncbi:MAG: tetratricopeptide repeat protein [Planctomycetes bacterium]|nr:tetratricopeptide repeat protein [Planctomycetota bacterium]
MSSTSLRLVAAAMVLLFAAPAALAQDDDARTAIQSVYEMSQSAETAEDYTKMIEESQRLLETGLSQQNSEYVRKLTAWAYNRRGEARAEEAGKHAAEGQTEAAAGLDAQALEDFNAAIQLDASRWKAYHNRGVSYAMTGDYQKALPEFNHALRLRPTFANSWFNRGEIHYELGNYEQAVADYNNVIRANPEDAEAYTRRGHAYFKLGRYREALTDYSRALELKPDRALAHLNRGEACLALGLWDQAARDYRQAITLDGSLGRAYQGAAWLMAACPDQRYRYPDRAVNAAQKAIELAGDEADYRYLDTLAAAQAAAGDFAKAQETIAAAIEQAPEDKVDDLTQRQTLYQQNQPYRIQ